MSVANRVCSSCSRTAKSAAKKGNAKADGGKPAVGGQALSWLRGRAVDPDGHGIPGLFVLPGSHGTFNSVGWSNTRTDAGGYYSIPCPRSPVLLATWRLNDPYPGASAGGPWAATFVGSKSGAPVVPRCDGQRYETTLVPGAALSGKVIDSGNCVGCCLAHAWGMAWGRHSSRLPRAERAIRRDILSIGDLLGSSYQR